MDDFKKDNKDNSEMNFDDDFSAENDSKPDLESANFKPKENNFDNNPQSDWAEQKSSNNPFDNNPFKSPEESAPEAINKQSQYTIDNEKIRSNREQSNGLAKILLVLLASIGLLIAAVWGLMSSNKKNNDNSPIKNISTTAKTKESNDQANIPLNEPNQDLRNLKEGSDFCSLNLAKEYKKQYLPLIEGEIKQVENQIMALEGKEELTPEDEIELNDLQAKLEDLQDAQAEMQNEVRENSCPIDSAHKYISRTIASLEDVTSRVEEKALEAKELKDKDQIQFLKDKLEGLSRAEAEIRTFSEPHLQKDLTITFTELSTPCKLKDTPKYLSAWLDEVKDRINTLQTDLGREETSPVIAEAPKEETKPEIKKPENEIKESTNEIKPIIENKSKPEDKVKAEDNLKAQNNKVKTENKKPKAQEVNKMKTINSSVKPSIKAENKNIKSSETKGNLAKQKPENKPKAENKKEIASKKDNLSVGAKKEDKTIKEVKKTSEKPAIAKKGITTFEDIVSPESESKTIKSNKKEENKAPAKENHSIQSDNYPEWNRNRRPRPHVGRCYEEDYPCIESIEEEYEEEDDDCY